MPAWEAACAGAWVHGRAAALLGAGMVADDLPAALPRAMKQGLLF
jgi:NAD(P)H-hydrate repair Nnr-like enzyme with NAD(P)H-hydrate dehydratase domain